MLITKPDYYDRFRCIASLCPDSCCQGWEIQVDEASASRYLALPGPLGDRLRQVLRRDGEEYWMENIQGRCPMWRPDGLCSIQSELGEAALCQTCRSFPRLRHDYGDFVELGLELSCPEAARLILTAPRRSLSSPQIPQNFSSGDYDAEAMAILLESRNTALSLLESHPLQDALSLLLLYGCHIQGILDEGESAPFAADSAIQSARSMAVSSDPKHLLPFFLRLEILTEGWKTRLCNPSPAPWHDGYRNLARYFVERYWLQAVSDYDLYSRVKLALIACLVIKTLGGDFLSTAQLFSKEIENNIDNLEALLDAAYRESAFTDEKLLGLLLEP